MNDTEYAVWKIKSENKYHLLDIDLYKGDKKINFNFISLNNLKLQLSTNDFFLKYLPSIYHLLDNIDRSTDRYKTVINNSKNFDSLFIYRNEVLKFKKDNFKFILTKDIYIELNTYKYIQSKLETWKEFYSNVTLRLSDFENIYNLFYNIIIPYKIDGTSDYNNFSLLKLLVCTDFSKYFFKANPEFLVKI